MAAAQILLAAAAIGRGDPAAAGIVGDMLRAAGRGGFVNTVVTTVPQVTRYLVEHSAQMQPEPFLDRLIGAALTQPERPGSVLVAPLSPAELRILTLLPTASYVQVAATLYISRNTVKSHLQSHLPEAGSVLPLGRDSASRGSAPALKAGQSRRIARPNGTASTPIARAHPNSAAVGDPACGRPGIASENVPSPGS
jgi:hypothetical protein